MTAAFKPAGPPPTTTTRLGVATRCNVPMPYSFSRPVAGVSMQPSQRFNPMRPTHSWLHDRHRRMSSVRFSRAFGKTRDRRSERARYPPGQHVLPPEVVRPGWDP